MFNCHRKRSFWIGTLACFLIGFGVLCCVFWNQVFYKILDMNLIISPTVFYFDDWKAHTETVEINVYFFNWTNPEDFLNHSAKPILQECGPYAFREKMEKINITWHANNGSVTYRVKSFLYFDAERSNGSLQDKVYAQNIVALTAANKSKGYNAVQAKMVAMGFDLFNQKRHLFKTIDELFLSGYNDNLLSAARNVPVFASDDNIPDKFGWFYGLNGSSNGYGTFNIYTGAKDYTRRGIINTWNYVNHTGFFEAHCGLINGSIGEFHASDLQPNSDIYVYSPELCRTMPLEYSETVQVEGITGYKYVAGQKFLDNGTLYPENTCFCHKQCYPSGISDASSCRFDSPLFLSLPHFYKADPYYLNSVKGLKPNKHLHEFYVVKEPRSGVTLEVTANFQINALVEPYNYLGIYKNVPRIFFPVLWMEKKWRIASNKAIGFRIMNIGYWFIYAFGGITLICGLILILWTFGLHGKCLKSKTSKTINQQKATRNKTESTALRSEKCYLKEKEQSALLTSK